MKATTTTGPTRDFSDIAIWRGSLAAMVVGYFLLLILTSIWSYINLGWFDLQSLLHSIQSGLRFAVEPPMLVGGFCGMGVAVVIGYFVMAAYKGDHTTYWAAMIIGARTAAIAFAIVFVLSLLVSFGAILGAGGSSASTLPGLVGQIVGLGALVLATGAITGLAARIAAGEPTVVPSQIQAGAEAA